MPTLSPSRQAALDLVSDGHVCAYDSPGSDVPMWVWTNPRRYSDPGTTALNWLMRNGHIALGAPDEHGKRPVTAAT